MVTPDLNTATRHLDPLLLEAGNLLIIDWSFLKLSV